MKVISNTTLQAPMCLECDEIDETEYDVCIIGAGPAGLATLSALNSPYSQDFSTMTPNQQERAAKAMKQRTKKLKVCVIDTHSTWLESWTSNFEQLGIEFLRSPALAHPDLFDPLALLEYAVRHDREDELLESGCGDIKKLFALGQSQIGLWKLPSTQLFHDFCSDLAKSLPHSFHGNVVVRDIDKLTFKKSRNGPASDLFRLTLQQNSCAENPAAENEGKLSVVQSKAVVLAVGATGRPVVPKGLRQPESIWRFWNQKVEPCSNVSRRSSHPTLVVGGGLTAIQVALKEICQSSSTSGTQVVLVSRQPLKEKHFDIDFQWFDQRTMNKCMSDFYHFPMEARKKALAEARRGGSIPPVYMKQLKQAEEDGRVVCLVGDVECMDANVDQNGVDNLRKIRIHPQSDHNDKVSEWIVKDIILACGVEPTCGEPSSLTGHIQAKFPTRVESGLPCVTEDLRWKEGLDLFVVGSLGALNIGPDAGNLMGMRRAAQLVSNAIGCRSWLRESVLVNPFEALIDDSDSEEDNEPCSDDENEG